MRYKVLSVKQPWAYLICSGIKDIENRTWKCPQKYIGQRVLIHASAKRDSRFNPMSRSLFTENQWESVLGRKIDGIFEKMLIPSAIIGSVEIVDCVVNHPSIWAEKTYYDKFEDIKPTYNWVLANPVLFDNPILNVNGKLGFWDYFHEAVEPQCCEVIGNIYDKEHQKQAIINMIRCDEELGLYDCGNEQ